jgi:hypothetical protein
VATAPRVARDARLALKILGQGYAHTVHLSEGARICMSQGAGNRKPVDRKILNAGIRRPIVASSALDALALVTDHRPPPSTGNYLFGEAGGGGFQARHTPSTFHRGQ